MRKWTPYGAGFVAGLLALAAAADVPFFIPALTNLQPVGSNPAANQMDSNAFARFTAECRAGFEAYTRQYAPDYSDSAWMLGPPKQGRLSKPLPLARGGRAEAEIVVDLDPALHTPEATLGRTVYPAEVHPMRKTGHRIVGHAADELKTWLDALTGGDFPIVSKPGSPKTTIFVGTSFARLLFPDDLAKLGEGECLDGFAVRTRGNAIYIFGATAKGVLNGVYAFIENNSDLIWAHAFSDLGTVYTVHPDLDAVWGDAREKPGTVQRGWLGHYTEVRGKPAPDWMWRMRNRCNFVVAPGPSPKVAEWGCWREEGGHCLGTAAPVRGKDFFPLRPDPKTGTMTKPDKILYNHHNLCMTHPDLPALYAEKLAASLRAAAARSPDAPPDAFRLGIEDPGPEKEYGLCQCERCLQSIRLPDGRIIPYQHATKGGLTFRSAQVYLLLEYLARAMAKDNPGTRLSTYAYYFAAEPPPFQVSVQPWLCPYGGGGRLVHRDYRHPLFWPTNARWWEYAYGWSRITDLTVLRDYNGLLTNGRPFAEVVAWDLRGLLPLGIKRFANETALDTAFLQMDFWVASRLYWNPAADVEELRKYYLRRTFREGAPEMERFFGEIRKWWFGAFQGREDFINLGWMIDQMKGAPALHRRLVKAEEDARHPLARANIARLRKTFEHWFHLNLEEATADAMLANARLGRHARYSSFLNGNTPVAVTVVSFKDDQPKDSEDLMAGAARDADFRGWTFRMRIRAMGAALTNRFPVPSLAFAGPPVAGATFLDKRDEDGGWSKPVAPERQPDGSYQYEVRLLPDVEAGGPVSLSTIRLAYSVAEWREPHGFVPEFAIYDMRLTDAAGKRFVLPGLAERQGNLPRKRYFEGGELGNE